MDKTAEESFLEYVRADAIALSRAAFLLTRDRQLAEDLVQETLLRVIGRWNQITRAGDPRPYVRRVMYHQHVSWWRRSRGRSQPVAEPPDQVGPDRTGAWDDSVIVCAALTRLTPRQRAVVVLRYFEDRTERETAEILGCRVGTVKSTTRDALVKLRSVVPDLAETIGATVAKGRQ